MLVLNPGDQRCFPFLRLALFIRVEVCRAVGRPSVEVVFKLRLFLTDQITFNEAEALGDQEVRNAGLVKD